MASPTKARFSRRGPDRITDELVIALADGAVFEFKELFLAVYPGLKLKNMGGGEENMRLRCYDKLRWLMDRGLVQKTGKCYSGLKGLECASSVHKLAKAEAVALAHFAASS
jgi:hypothetical protein